MVCKAVDIITLFACMYLISSDRPARDRVPLFFDVVDSVLAMHALASFFFFFIVSFLKLEPICLIAARMEAWIFLVSSWPARSPALFFMAKFCVVLDSFLNKELPIRDILDRFSCQPQFYVTFVIFKPSP
jgi:hypothetical protein